MANVDPPAPAPLADRLQFPPFPKPPAGVKIIPFHEFKASGIQIAVAPEPDYVEVDGLGIPTLTLRVKHDLTETEQRKRKKGRRTAGGPSGQRLTWWEDWEQGESMRTTAARAVSVDPVNRLHLACQDFKSTRSWPSPETGVSHLWEVWRLYIGIISRIQPPPGQRKPKISLPEPDWDSDEDDEEFLEDKKPQNHTVMVVDEATVKRRRYMEEQEQEEQRNQQPPDEQAKERQHRRQERKEANMDFFFNDPETFVKIFFTAHFRDKGHSWVDKNLTNGPILIEFFIRFLLRNRVYPEHEDKLKKALDVCRQARTELPATSTLSKAINNLDTFGKGCKAIMGEFTNSIFKLTVVPLATDDTSGEGERSAKKPKLEQESESEELKNFKASLTGNLQMPLRITST
ncbi:hypothetical protein NM688_g6326 [Phlebia brevispora]|uniref:Uncharacterized protein n=1 Tax=Phlebia brevispora TaxID=194682 RepID=A0ACC1SH19_9APHY|nr:hypothetical protein NM688_g6326 [Phlebia brevispora]